MEASYQGTVTRGNGDPHWGATVFARLLALPDEAVLKVLTVVMAETLAAGSALVEAAGRGRQTGRDPVVDGGRYLSRSRPRSRCSAKWQGKGSDANVSETAKVQRKIVHDCLTGEGRERADGWVPRYMAFPAGHYDPSKTLKIEADWEAVKPLFTGE